MKLQEEIKIFIPLLEYMKFVESYSDEYTIIYNNGNIFGTKINFLIRDDILLCSISEIKKFAILGTSIRYDVYEKFIMKFENELVGYFRKLKIKKLLK